MGGRIKPKNVRLNERKIPKQLYAGITWLVLFFFPDCRLAERWWGSAEFRDGKKTHSLLLPFKEILIIDGEALCLSVLHCSSSLVSDISHAFYSLYHLCPAAFLLFTKKNNSMVLWERTKTESSGLLQSLNSCNVLGSIPGRSSSHTSSAISVHTPRQSTQPHTCTFSWARTLFWSIPGRGSTIFFFFIGWDSFGNNAPNNSRLTPDSCFDCGYENW